MNKKYILLALMCMAAVSFTSCVEENFENINPAQKGDEIVFGARAGFENSDPETRTVYSGVTYTFNNANYERIDWIDGDMIEIYSPQALNSDRSHYKVVGMNSGDESLKDGTNKGEDYANLERYESSGLQWSEGVHDFYAMYPSTKYFDENSETNVAQGVKMEGSTVRGIVPNSQTPSSFTMTTENGKPHYVANPDMRYAYMVAKSTSTPDKNNVSLSFVPIVTALQVELVMPETVDGETNVNSVNVAVVRVEGKGIAGAFSSDLANWSGAYPTCSVGEGSDLITISMWQEQDNGDLRPLSMVGGSKLTFTVFLLPGAEIKDIKVSFSDGAAGFIGKTLTGSTIPTYKKTIIKNLNLPTKKFTVEVGNWMSQLDQDTPFNRLSIPGAGAAFSWNGSDGYKSQTLTFEQQWKAGIRAFEIITDRQAGTEFGSESIRCNNQAVSGWDVDKVMTEVTTRLSGTSECAVLIFTYQPTGNTSYPRDPGTYVMNLCNYFKDYTDNLVKYSPDLTLQNAQGQIIVIVRPTQFGEDSDDEIEAALNAVTTAGMTDELLVVSGCGTAKDKWKTRNYLYNGVAVPEQGSVTTSWLGFGSSSCGANDLENAILKSANWANVTKSGLSEFNYPTSSDYDIWYQEWARVVPDTDKNGKDEVVITFGNYAWRESYNEKLTDVKKAFDMALDGTSDYVFVNSLSGFYVTDKYDLSSKPLNPNSTVLDGSFYEGGSQGDIAGLAADLNEDFYQYVLQKGDQTGATGIVMMDFVANQLTTDNEGNPANAGSYYLPGVIINNNFKFNPIEVPEAPVPDKTPTEKEEEA